MKIALQNSSHVPCPLKLEQRILFYNSLWTNSCLCLCVNRRFFSTNWRTQTFFLMWFFAKALRMHKILNLTLSLHTRTQRNAHHTPNSIEEFLTFKANIPIKNLTNTTRFEHIFSNAQLNLIKFRRQLLILDVSDVTHF